MMVPSMLTPEERTRREVDHMPYAVAGRKAKLTDVE